MGSTSVSAVNDRNVIHSRYVRSFVAGDNSEPVDLSFKVIHKYRDSSNVLREVVLESLTIPSASLLQKGNLTFSSYTQELDLTIGNLRYLNDVYLEVSEVRDSILLVKRVPVLIGDDSQVLPLPSNPIKEPQFKENLPPAHFIPPANVMTPEPSVAPILYLFSERSVDATATSRRAFLGENNTFFEQEYADTNERVFIENAVKNLLPNGLFANVTNRVPDSYEIAAPGINLNSYVESVKDIEGTSLWKIRASNPNVFSAFSSIELRTKELQYLPSATPHLAASVYYRVTSQGVDTPFNDLNLSLTFYDSSEMILGSITNNIPVASEGSTWNLLSAVLNSGQIPLAATFFTFSIEIPNIDRTENFEIQFYLPQVEVSTIPTSRALSERIQDIYYTSDVIRFQKPFYIAIKIAGHSPDSSIKGLADATHLLEAGFQFFTSNNTLTFRQYDVNGALMFSVTSPPLGVLLGTPTEYGVYSDGTTIEFYKDANLHSTHPQPHTILLNKKIVVGSLENPGTTINSELLDFRITKIQPI